MTVTNFLKECTLEEFTEWLKDVCIDNSFNNIKDGKSFKTIIINYLECDEDDIIEYYLFTDRDSIKDLFHTLQSYAKLPEKEQEIFKLRESTRLFIYSYIDELLKSCNSDIKDITEFYKSLGDDYDDE